jgi:hypothetical protein
MCVNTYLSAFEMVFSLPATVARSTANPASIRWRPDKSIHLCRAGAFDLLTNGRIENIIQFLKILIEPSHFMDKKERHLSQLTSKPNCQIDEAEDHFHHCRWQSRSRQPYRSL